MRLCQHFQVITFKKAGLPLIIYFFEVHGAKIRKVNGEWAMVNEENFFMGQTVEYELSFCCVALLYDLLINDLNVQVSDTTKMTKEQRPGTYNL